MVNVASAPVVAVTGSAGYIGSQLLQELENETSLAKLVAVDLKPLTMPFHNIDAYRLDITKPLDTVFHDHHINTVVHLAFDLREGHNPQEAQAIQSNNLVGLENLLRACRAGRVSNFIYLSSHTVYGARSDNPVPITEEAPLRPVARFQYSQTKVLSEEILQRFARENPQVGVTVLRCCMVLGPEGISHVAKAFQKPVLIKVTGYDPPLQFIHDKDLARILTIFSMEPRPGVFNVAGESVVRFSRMARIMRQRLISLPFFIAYPLVQMSWKLGLQKEASAAGLGFIQHPIIMTTGKLKRATGYRFQYTAEEAVSSYAASNLT